MNRFQKLIKEICDKKGIEFKLLSDDYIIELKKDDKVRYIYGFKFDLNSHGAGLIIDDKYGLYKILQDFNIPAVEHEIVYDRLHVTKYDNNYEYVKKYFIEHNNHVVIKPNHGSGGSGVYNITDISQIEPTMNVLFEKNQSICVCPFYDAVSEYRVVVLNGKAELSYIKQKPKVVGDSVHTIKELLIMFNEQYFAKKRLIDVNDIRNYSRRANSELEVSSHSNIDFDRVLKKDEVFEYSWKFNSSCGAKIEILNNIDERIINIAEETSKNVNLSFGNVDIIEMPNGDFYVIEVNSGVDIINIIELQQYAESIYTKAIETLLD